ncbi:outer membrane beta-barrel protein [Algibacter agarivorans]
MKKFITLSMLFMATALFAQEEATEKKLSISGSVDTYYRTVLTASDALTPATESSFADQTGFALGMANIIASYEGEKTGVVADLAFGTRGLQAVGGGTDVFINQLYAYWNVSEGTTLTLGRFNTYLGYEVISPVGNFNYSTSYMFSYGPFSHVGLKADFALSDDFSLMTAIMNVTDVNNNTTGDYALGAQLGYSGQFLNFYYDGGAGIGFEIDYTGGFDLSDDFFLGINAAYQDNDGAGFYGAALYPQLATSDSFTIGLRGEYFQQLEDGGVLANLSADESILGLTLTGSYTLENLIIKPELRLDSASEELANFPDSDGLASKSLAAFTLAAIYSF